MTVAVYYEEFSTPYHKIENGVIPQPLATAVLDITSNTDHTITTGALWARVTPTANTIFDFVAAASLAASSNKRGIASGKELLIELKQGATKIAFGAG